MKATIPLALVSALLLSPAAQGATRSWGKPGATREAFDAGSRACALKAATRDVAGDEQTERYRRGFEALERENNMPPMAGGGGAFERAERQVLLRRAYRPDQQVDALQAKLQHEVDACLIAAGYIPFDLSRDQERKLKTLRPGSEPRRAYLYALGSDADVVAAQRVTP